MLKIIPILILVILSFGCQTKESPTTNTQAVSTNQDFFTQDSRSVSERTKANFEKAKTAALAWKNDAALFAYQIKIPYDFEPLSVIETFIFGSPAEAQYWYTYSINSEGKSIRSLVFKRDYIGENISPVQENFWNKSYIEAINIAEENGGEDFRTKNQNAQINMVLSQSQPKNWLWWVVIYQGSDSDLKVRISANDGKVYDENGNLITSKENETTNTVEIK